MRHVEAYQNGEDNGWLHKQNYWFDPNHEHGFGIVDLDSIYPEKYFETDHVKPETVKAYVDHVYHFFNLIGRRELRRVVEFGCAGGWFTKAFEDKGARVIAFEGSTAGMERAIGRGCANVQHLDMRYLLDLTVKERMDIALCTEVAEHIEPPFSAVLVLSLIQSADLVWFSSEEPNTNPAHIHHPNEMPDIFWINLFEFYGYGCYRLPQWVYDQTEGRGKFIFYNKKVYEGNQFLQQ